MREWIAGRWRPLSLAAMGFSLAHLFIDFHIGLFGASSQRMRLQEAALAATFGLLYAAWARALARASEAQRGGFVASLIFAAGWAFFVNGVAALGAAPPPSWGFPYQDIAHFGSLVFGGLATVGLVRQLRDVEGRLSWRPALWPGVLIAGATAMEAVVAL
jgi:hypothetical protein